MPLTPKNRKEEWLQGLVDHETTLTPKNRPEEWMKGLIEGSTTLTPKNRCEEWLKEIIDASGGGQSNYILIGHKEITFSTTSTSEVSVDSIQTDPSAYENMNDKFLYIRVRDKAGKREGYFFETDSFFTSVNQTQPACITARFVSNHVAFYTGSFGIYPSLINANGVIDFSAKFNNTYSKTINGTYAVDIYLINYPDGISPDM